MTDSPPPVESVWPDHLTLWFGPRPDSEDGRVEEPVEPDREPEPRPDRDEDGHVAMWTREPQVERGDAP